MQKRNTHTHTETHRGAHTDSHTLGSEHHSTGGKNKPLKNKLSVVLYAAHYFRASQGKHIFLTALKLFLCPHTNIAMITEDTAMFPI